jgi:hypothetical protein
MLWVRMTIEGRRQRGGSTICHNGTFGVFTTHLLEEAGVDSALELGQRNADNLHAKLSELNAAKKTGAPPAERRSS